jgi:hypothetical protein
MQSAPTPAALSAPTPGYTGAPTPGYMGAPTPGFTGGPTPRYPATPGLFGGAAPTPGASYDGGYSAHDDEGRQIEPRS